jgi:hypothetical protein
VDSKHSGRWLGVGCAGESFSLGAVGHKDVEVMARSRTRDRTPNVQTTGLAN